MREHLHNEDGAVLVFVALILVVVIGFGAIAVDTGALYQEHRELQNGADAAALALAQGCADGNTLLVCSAGFADLDSAAEYFADLNANDGTMEAVVDSSQYSARKLKVNTTSLQAGQPAGSIGTTFARILGIDTANPAATATGTWGSPVMGSLGVLPLVISDCEYDRYVTNAGPPTATEPWTTTQNGPMQIIKFHTGADAAEPCASGPSGLDLPGGFGWIDTSSSCSPLVIGNTAEADTGVSPSNDCSPQEIYDILYDKTVFVPVFTQLTGTGNNGVYTLTYYAAFHISAYNFGGQYTEPAGYQCGGNTGSLRCIAGWFTTGSPGSGKVGNGPDTGVRVYGLSG